MDLYEHTCDFFRNPVQVRTTPYIVRECPGQVLKITENTVLFRENNLPSDIAEAPTLTFSKIYLIITGIINNINMITIYNL